MEAFANVFIEKYDQEFSIPYQEEMTLEDFKNSMEKVVGSIKIPMFNKYKDQKLTEYIKKNPTIVTLDNANLGSLLKNSKVNFINKSNSCARDTFCQVIIHSLVPKIIEIEEQQNLKNGKLPCKNFKEYKNPENNDGHYNQFLDMLDEIKDKVKKNDSNPIPNSFDKNNKPPSQSYEDCGNYFPRGLNNLSNSSNNTNTGLLGGSIKVLEICNGNTVLSDDYLNNHEIYLKKKTVVSDCIKIEVRSFQKCLMCNFSNISVINLGNIVKQIILEKKI